MLLRNAAEAQPILVVEEVVGQLFIRKSDGRVPNLGVNRKVSLVVASKAISKMSQIDHHSRVLLSLRCWHLEGAQHLLDLRLEVGRLGFPKPRDAQSAVLQLTKDDMGRPRSKLLPEVPHDLVRGLALWRHDLVALGVVLVAGTRGRSLRCRLHGLLRHGG